VRNALFRNYGIGLHLTSSSQQVTFGKNTAHQNQAMAGGPCSGVPALFLPDSCNDSAFGFIRTFGDNLIPGPSPY
jgi:hypothetical protein